MKRTMLIGCAVAALALNAAETLPPAEQELAAKLPEIFAKSAAHYRALDAAATPLMKVKVKGDAPDMINHLPHSWDPKTGKLQMFQYRWWTAGHYPGSLWYLYEATGDAFFRDRATMWTELLEPNSEMTDNHDVGFIMYCSYGNARRLLKTDKYDALLVKTAESLSKRYNEKLGLIRSWGKIDETENFKVIPDNLMNLELLEFAAKCGGQGLTALPGADGRAGCPQPAAFDKIARSHADVTMKNHFRSDGSCYHVLDYDQKTGRVKGRMRGQGAGMDSAWSRGQSWAIYGYAMMYRETGDRRYLDFAQKLADYAINAPTMPTDGVPYWDYGCPGEERDSSAASIMASGLLELAECLESIRQSNNPTIQQSNNSSASARYRAFAVKQLLSLSSPAYFAAPGENGEFLLKHGTGNKPRDSEVDVPLDYGDYYYLEALIRFQKSIKTVGGFRVKEPRFAKFEIPGLEPKPDFWQVRPDEVIDLCQRATKCSRKEVICRSPLGYPVYALFYGDFSDEPPQSNWSAAVGSTTYRNYYGNRKDGKQTFLLLAGVHGSEAESVAGAVNIIQTLETGADFRGKRHDELLKLISQYRFIVVPLANPDGRLISPDHLRGVKWTTFRAVSQGLWKDGTRIGWHGSKGYFPLPLDKVAFPGGYPNSEGYNIMHDATPGDIRAEETMALLKLAARWRVDAVLNGHSCESAPNVLWPSTIGLPADVARGSALAYRCTKAICDAGLSPREPKADKVNKDRTINLNTMFALASGALALTLECSVSYDRFDDPPRSKPSRTYTFDELMEPVFISLAEFLKDGLEKPFLDRGSEEIKED